MFNKIMALGGTRAQRKAQMLGTAVGITTAIMAGTITTAGTAIKIMAGAIQVAAHSLPEVVVDLVEEAQPVVAAVVVVDLAEVVINGQSQKSSKKNSKHEA